MDQFFANLSNVVLEVWLPLRTPPVGRCLRRCLLNLWSKQFQWCLRLSATAVKAKTTIILYNAAVGQQTWSGSLAVSIFNLAFKIAALLWKARVYLMPTKVLIVFSILSQRNLREWWPWVVLPLFMPVLWSICGRQLHGRFIGIPVAAQRGKIGAAIARSPHSTKTRC